jgi:hypothetical protein
VFGLQLARTLNLARILERFGFLLHRSRIKSSVHQWDMVTVGSVRAPVGPNVQFGTDFRAIWIFAASIADKIISASRGYGDRRFSEKYWENALFHFWPQICQS